MLVIVVILVILVIFVIQIFLTFLSIQLFTSRARVLSLDEGVGPAGFFWHKMEIQPQKRQIEMEKALTFPSLSLQTYCS